MRFTKVPRQSSQGFYKKGGRESLSGVKYKVKGGKFNSPEVPKPGGNVKKLKYGLAFYGAARIAPLWIQMAEAAGWDGCFLGDAIWIEDPMIKLAAAAVLTNRIRLGTMVIPVPLRRPWQIASESVALDHLSNGRLILGLGTGAVWMGWQGFPDEPTDTKTRAEMLSETVAILTKLFQREPFDFDGKHYHLRLTLVDEMHYPPKPVQQPRIPIWIPGIWPKMKSMQRVLDCDGLLPLKMNANRQFEEVTPEDLRAMKAYIDSHRSLTTPFDYVAEGRLAGVDQSQARERLSAWAEAGATWYIEGLWEASPEQVEDVIRRGPPDF